MKEIVNQYIAKGYSVKSSETYAKWIVKLDQYCLNKPLEKVSIKEIHDFIFNYLGKRKRLSSQSVNSAISAIDVFFNKILNKNYNFNNFERPKRTSRTVDSFTPSEILQIINSITNLKHKLAVTLLYSCGLDISSIVLIQVADINLKKKEINLRSSKNKVNRIARLGPLEVNLIDSYIKIFKPNNFLFQGQNNKEQYSTRSIQKIVKTAIKEVGIKKEVSSRSLKYSYIQHFTELGYPLKNILKHLGFKSSQNATQYYESTYNPEKQITQSPLEIISNFRYNDKADELNLKITLSLEKIGYIYESPFLNTTEIEAAIRMSRLYIIIHCYENSTRKFIDTVLRKKYGDDWWNIVAPQPMKEKVKDKQTKEVKNRWQSCRGDLVNPLYYVDWSDLLKIIRRKEELFEPYLSDVKFVELRLEELERTRHIIAHNGILPSDDDYQRLELYYKEWIKQLK